MEAPLVRAEVVEQNGEISCSIEETNRIRAVLGLRPLNNKSSNDAVLNFQRAAEEKAQ